MDIERLPLPRSGKITHAIHIADVHIRAGDDAKSRRAEYASVFDALMLSLRAMECVAGGSAVIVVAGDVFHDKGRIEPPGIALFDTLLGLADIAPLYIIRGNHDYRQDDPETMDLISALVGRRSGNVAYLDRTGLYDAGNVGFGLLAIQDVLQPGATSGDVTRTDRPPFPDPSPLLTSPKDALVALFHGTISRARLPNGRRIEKDAVRRDAVRRDDANTFARYDIAMLGDVHEMQVDGVAQDKEMTAPTASPSIPLFSKSFGSSSNEDNRACCWAYSGSLVQQNFGETLFRHGFLLWDFERREVHGYHVPNCRGMLNVERRADEFVCPLSGLDACLVPLGDLLNHDAFPDEVSLKIPCDAEEQELKAVIEAAGKRVAFVRRGLQRAPGEEVDRNADISSDYSGPAAWIEYVAGKSDDDALARVPWRDWFTNTDAACVATSSMGPLPASLIADLVRSRNEKIMAKGRSAAAIVADACSRRRAFQLLRVDFSWMFCYGPDMYVDFRDMSGRVVALTAKNGAGKSSLLETICYAVFGEGFPSRSTTPYTAAVICQQKPASQKAWTRVQFQTNGNTYVLRRNFSGEGTRLHVKDATLFLKKTDAQQETVREGSKAVREWLTAHVGSVDAFLMACMLTQGGDRDFFALRPKEQKAAISKALALDAADAIFDVFHEAKLAHAAVADTFHAAITAMRSKEAQIPRVEQRDVDDSLRIERQLADERTKVTDAVQSARERMGNAFADIVRTRNTDRSLDEYARDVQQRLRDACDKSPDERAASTAAQELAMLQARVTEFPARGAATNELDADIVPADIVPADIVSAIERLLNAVVARSAVQEDDLEALARARERLEATLRDGESLAADRLRDCREMHSHDVRRLEEVVAEQPPVPISLGRKRLPEDKTVAELDAALRELRMVEPCVPRDNTYEEVAASLAKRDVWLESCEEEMVTASDERLATMLADARRRLDRAVQEHELADAEARIFRERAASARTVWKSLDSEYRAHEQCKPAESTISQAEFDFWQTRKRAVLEEGTELLRCEDAGILLDRADAKIAEYERNADRTRRLQLARQDALREISTEREHPFNPECRACQARQRLDSEANKRLTIVAEWARELQDHGSDGDCWSTLLQKIHDWKKEADAVLSKADFHEEHARRRADFDVWKEEQRRLRQTRDEAFEQIASHEDDYRAAQTIADQTSDTVTNARSRLDAIASFVSQREAWRALDVDGANEAWKRHQEWTQEIERLQHRRDDACFWAQFDAAMDEYAAWQTRKERAVAKRLESEREVALATTNLETITSKSLLLSDAIEYVSRVQEGASIWRRCIELEEIVRAKTEYDDLRELADALPHYKQYEENVKRLSDIDASLEDAIRNTTTLKLRLEAKHDAAREIAEYVHALQLVTERHNALERLCHLGREFKTWVFDTKVATIIERQVNSLLAYGDHADLRLVARMHGDDIQWFVRNGANCPPIDKASGFQRFVVGFAMRIALGRIGAVDVACKQLFVDEGFVACDADNLARVPGFLHALVSRFFDSIVLVSHLDAIKDAADIRIPIQRETGFSRIRFGRADDWIPEDTRHGRPSKRAKLQTRVDQHVSPTSKKTRKPLMGASLGCRTLRTS